jgi:hypothetical protein
MMLRRSLLSIAVLASLAAPAMAQTAGGVPVTNNTATNTNVAAGNYNTAFQNIYQSQKGGKSGYTPSYGSSSTPSVTNNTAINTNVAAGLYNQAFQNVFQSQKGH